jgi:hypothetical protein
MLKIMMGAALGILLVGLATDMTHGQAAGTTQVRNAEVTQGDVVTMDVTVDKAANIEGTVYVIAFPDGMTNGGVTAQCTLATGKTTCTPRERVPLDAKLGKWVITEITFQPLAGEKRVLSKHGDSSFQVVAHGKIVLPDSATISNIK